MKFIHSLTLILATVFAIAQTNSSRTESQRTKPINSFLRQSTHLCARVFTQGPARAETLLRSNIGRVLTSL